MGNVALVVPNLCKKKEKYIWHPPLSSIRKHYLANDQFSYFKSSL